MLLINLDVNFIQFCIKQNTNQIGFKQTTILNIDYSSEHFLIVL